MERVGVRFRASWTRDDGVTFTTSRTSPARAVDDLAAFVEDQTNGGEEFSYRRVMRERMAR